MELVKVIYGNCIPLKRIEGTSESFLAWGVEGWRALAEKFLIRRTNIPESLIGREFNPEIRDPSLQNVLFVDEYNFNWQAIVQALDSYCFYKENQFKNILYKYLNNCRRR